MSLLVWLATTYSIRMFGVTAGYHRYFGHRSYKLGRIAQFAMAFLAQSSGQKGVLWWAAHHRLHHRESDRDRDVHSPTLRGFWWAHVGWVISNDFDNYDPRSVNEFLRFPEIRWLDRHHWTPDGSMVMQAITMNERRFDAYRKKSDWIQRRIFPGAQLASIREILNSLVRSTRLSLYNVEDIGLHYAYTLGEWRRRFHESIDDVRALGFDEAFCRTVGLLSSLLRGRVP